MDNINNVYRTNGWLIIGIISLSISSMINGTDNIQHNRKIRKQQQTIEQLSRKVDSLIILQNKK